MRKLNLPVENAIDVFDKCISKVSNTILKDRLENCKPSIVTAEVDYTTKASIIELHTIVPHNSINGNVTKEEMIKVYSDRMVGATSPGRYIYDKWRASAPNNICPLCAQRTTETLEHHLPKSKYPIYSIVPINIFPACSSCNKIKLDLVVNSPEREPIHPYFDDVDDELWLKAAVIETKPASIKFYTVKPDNWDDIKYARVENHFRLFELEKLYASHSAEELTINNFRINNLFESGGVLSVRNFLEGSWLSMRNANVNSWQTATYEALFNSNWYQEGGFKSE
ncbi:hypothetical protein [Polaribacter sp. NJDZ03]|uniref:hypothetical protein n=1 Tax=Polaribacter sp. NJDZ03 TaxID=2855841 RepID=UPI001C4A50A2|nr:hypothetical protein [Polaribacter sp. NJDZ03]